MAAHTSTMSYAVKRALITALADAYAADPSTAGVEVEYAAFGVPERERVHGGAVHSEQAYPYIGGSPRKTRSDVGTVEIHIMAVRSGWTVEEADARVLELGRVLEHRLAGDPRLLGADGRPLVPGMSWCGVVEVDGDYYLADDAEVGSALTYTIRYQGQLK